MEGANNAILLGATVKTISATIALSMFCAQPAFASETTDIGILGLLGLNTAKGETTLGDHAGELEAWTQSAKMMGEAAVLIWEQNGQSTTGRYLILADSEKFNLNAYATVVSRTKYLTQRYAKAKKQADCGGKSDLKEISTMNDGNLGDIVTAIAGALRSDTAISAIPVEPAERAFVNAIAAHFLTLVKDGNVMLADGLVPNADSTAASGWENLRTRFTELGATKKCAGNATAKAAIAAFEAADETLLAGDDKGNLSLMEQASMLDPKVGGELTIIRPRIEKAAGTIIKTTNLLTVFTGPSIKISGGLIFSFRAFKSNSATAFKLSAAGIARCNGPMEQMSKVNALPGTGSRVPAVKHCTLIGG